MTLSPDEQTHWVDQARRFHKLGHANLGREFDPRCPFCQERHRVRTWLATLLARRRNRRSHHVWRGPLRRG